MHAHYASDVARELATINDAISAKHWFAQEKETLNNVAMLFDKQKKHFLKCLFSF